jgi:TM2 domain-containing membrane protein YozV
MPHHNPYLNPAFPPKSTGVAYVLWFLLGVFGVHQFYMGKIGRGILYLLTGGVFGIMWFIDLFTLPGQLRNVNAQRAVGIR